MYDFHCDYTCKTVGESINKYNIPDNWCAEFDACDGTHPLICTQVDHIRKTPAMMDLKLRMVENEDEEYAGCVVYASRNIIAFKIDYLCDLITAIEAEQI